MILIPASLMIIAAFWAVDKLARIQKDAQWRAWLDAHRTGIGPDGLDCFGRKPRLTRKLKNVLTQKR
jgi:hypothetical protein